MNRKLLKGSIPLLMLAVMAGGESRAQETPPPPTTRKEIRTILINEGGKTVTDTVITEKEMKITRFKDNADAVWVASDAEAGNDSQVEELIIRKGDGTERRISLRKTGDAPEGMVFHEEIMDGDSGKMVRVFVRKAGSGEEDVLIRRDGRPGSRRMVTRRMAPGTPMLPGFRTVRRQHFQNPNIIDLSDPGILSFKKKKMSGGREKITVIRKEVQEMTLEENQIMQIDHNLETGGDEELERMNAPRVVRELDIRRKDLPAPAEVPAPAEKK